MGNSKHTLGSEKPALALLLLFKQFISTLNPYGMAKYVKACAP